MFLNTLSWVCKITIVVILGQTLFFKFGGALESKYIFSTLGMEPWGRIGSGLVELSAIALLLIPRFSVYGSLLTIATMGGAIISHLAILGIEIKGEFEGQAIESDGGLLFSLAVLALLCALFIVLTQKRKLSV